MYAILQSRLCLYSQNLCNNVKWKHKWKVSYVIPLYKKASKWNWNCNYRGISKLSAIPMLFEKIIRPHLQHSCRSLISARQSGLTKRRPTTTNLLEFTSFVINGFKENFQIYTDFSKAFESLNQAHLGLKSD